MDATNAGREKAVSAGQRQVQSSAHDGVLSAAVNVSSGAAGRFVTSPMLFASGARPSLPRVGVISRPTPVVIKEQYEVANPFDLTIFAGLATSLPQQESFWSGDFIKPLSGTTRTLTSPGAEASVTASREKKATGDVPKVLEGVPGSVLEKAPNKGPVLKSAPRLDFKAALSKSIELDANRRVEMRKEAPAAPEIILPAQSERTPAPDAAHKGPQRQSKARVKSKRAISAGAKADLDTSRFVFDHEKRGLTRGLPSVDGGSFAALPNKAEAPGVSSCASSSVREKGTGTSTEQGASIQEVAKKREKSLLKGKGVASDSDHSPESQMLTQIAVDLLQDKLFFRLSEMEGGVDIIKSMNSKQILELNEEFGRISLDELKKMKEERAADELKISAGGASAEGKNVSGGAGLRDLALDVVFNNISSLDSNGDVVSANIAGPHVGYRERLLAEKREAEKEASAQDDAIMKKGADMLKDIKKSLRKWDISYVDNKLGEIGFESEGNLKNRSLKEIYFKDSDFPTKLHSHKELMVGINGVMPAIVNDISINLKELIYGYALLRKYYSQNAFDPLLDEMRTAQECVKNIYSVENAGKWKSLTEIADKLKVRSIKKEKDINKEIDLMGQVRADLRTSLENLGKFSGAISSKGANGQDGSKTALYSEVCKKTKERLEKYPFETRSVKEMLDTKRLAQRTEQGESSSFAERHAKTDNSSGRSRR